MISQNKTETLVAELENNILYVQNEIDKIKDKEDINIKDISDLERFSNIIMNFSNSIVQLERRF